MTSFNSSLLQQAKTDDQVSTNRHFRYSSKTVIWWCWKFRGCEQFLSGIRGPTCSSKREDADLLAHVWLTVLKGRFLCLLMGRIFIKKNFRLYNRIVNYTVTISQFGRWSIRSPLESLDKKSRQLLLAKTTRNAWWIYPNLKSHCTSTQLKILPREVHIWYYRKGMWIKRIMSESIIWKVHSLVARTIPCRKESVANVSLDCNYVPSTLEIDPYYDSR